MKIRTILSGPLAAVLVAGAFSLPAEAAPETWLGGTSAWSAAGNWAGANSPPQSGDSLLFGAAGAGGLNLANDLTSAGFSIAGITFLTGAAAFVIGDGTAAHTNAGNPFVLAGSIIDQSANLETIQDPFSLTTNQTLSVAPANGALLLTGSISGSAGVTVTGSGTVRLSGAETFTGALAVNSGTLVASGSSTGSAAIVSGGTLEVDYSTGSTGNILDASKVLTIGGNAAAFVVNGGATSQTQTFAGLALQVGASTISLSNNGAATGLSFSNGVISRSPGATLNLLAPGGTAVTLSGNNSTPLLGPWAFFNGSNYAATNGSGVVQAATLTSESTPGLNGLTSPSTNYAYTSPGTPDVQSIPAATANTVTFAVASPQTLDLGASGANTLTLNGFINNGAPLTIRRTGGSGALRAGATNELIIGGTGNVIISVPIADNPGNPSALTISNTGTVISTGANSFTGGTNVITGTLQIGNGSTNGNFGLGTYTIAGGAVLKLSYASVVTAPLWGNLAGAGTLELAVAVESDWAGGPGQQYIALTPAFTGTLQIDSGRVPANGAAAVGGTTAIVIGNGGQFATFNGGTFSQNLTLAGTGWGETGYESALRMANGTLTGTYTGTVALSASATVAATGTGIFSGPISGPAAATLTTGTNRRPADGNGQEGTVIFNGSNSYSGATVVKAGTLQLSGAGGTNLGSTAYTVNGTLILSNLSSAGGNNNNRMNDTAGLSLIGGTFLYLGADTAATNSTETVGTLSGTGSSTITVSFGGSNTATLSATALTHAQGAGSVLVNGLSLGRDGTTTASTGRFFVSAAPTLSAGAAALSSGINSFAQNTQIVPFLVGEALASSGGLGTASGVADTFLTYNSATGFRPLNPVDEFTQNAFVSGNNTRLTTATTASAGGAINSLVLAGGTLTIPDGKTLTVSSGAVLFASANAINPSTSTGALAFGSAEAMVTVDAGLTGTIAAPISGSNGLTKGGRGTLVLSGTNTIAGGVTVSGGILQVTTSSAIPSTVTVNGNGTFELNGQSLQSPVAVSVTISGMGAPGTAGALSNSAGGEGSVSNLILAADAQIGSSNNKLNLYGSAVNLAGHTLTVAGAGTTDIRTDNALQGAGTVQIVQGTLRFESSQAGAGFTFNVGAFGTLDTFNNRALSENVTLNGGTLGNGFGSSTWSGAFTLLGASTVNDHGNQIALTGSVGGSGSLSKAGAGTVTLAGNNSYSGGTTISAGTLAVTQASTGATPLGSGVVTLAGGVLSVRGAQAPLAATGWNADVIHDAAENTANFGTNSTVDGVGYIFYGSGSAGAPQKGLPANGAVVNPVNGGLFQLQPYTANNVLQVTSGNTALLSFANPAPCNVLRIADTGGNGAATYKFTLNFSDGTSTTVTGQTAPDWFSNLPSIDSDFGRVTQSGAYDNRATFPRLYENVFTLSAADAAKVLSSIAFTSTGGGILNVFAVTAGVSSQTYANNLNVTADSTLDVQGSTNAAFGNLTIGANALTVTGTSGATAALGAVTLSGNAIFTPAAGISLSLGPIGQDSNPRNLTKSGAGTLLLTGVSSYSGATAVNSGTVIVSGSLSATSGGTVNPGATLLLAGGSISGNLACNGTVGGTGAIAGALSLSGGTLAPGNGPNHAGTLTAGDVQLDSSSTLSIALGGTGAGQFSVLIPNSIALASDGGSGATLTLSLTGGYTPAAGDLFPFALSASAPAGQFNNTNTTYVGGSTYAFTMGGRAWEINYAFPSSGSQSGMDQTAFATATGGDYIALLALVPEPDSLTLAGVSAGLMLGVSRLRRRATFGRAVH